jgi:hypothetical protein
MGVRVLWCSLCLLHDKLLGLLAQLGLEEDALGFFFFLNDLLELVVSLLLVLDLVGHELVVCSSGGGHFDDH